MENPFSKTKTQQQFRYWKGRVKKALNQERRLLDATHEQLMEMFTSKLTPTEAASRCVVDNLTL